jgi:hypothetical protein
MAASGAKRLRPSTTGNGVVARKLKPERHVRVNVLGDGLQLAGFRDAVGAHANIVGVRIQEEKNLKLYRKGQNPVLRGLANIRGARSAHLWTRGWTPRIQTYPGREVPNPLIIEISKGDAPIEVVLKDILALTKLNYNTCIFGDGTPITLKFANAIGEILTAGPLKDVPPLPFGHYI